jgi:hypothetical protein
MVVRKRQKRTKPAGWLGAAHSATNALMMKRRIGKSTGVDRVNLLFWAQRAIQERVNNPNAKFILG